MVLTRVDEVRGRGIGWADLTSQLCMRLTATLWPHPLSGRPTVPLLALPATRLTHLLCCLAVRQDFDALKLVFDRQRGLLQQHTPLTVRLLAVNGDVPARPTQRYDKEK